MLRRTAVWVFSSSLLILVAWASLCIHSPANACGDYLSLPSEALTQQLLADGEFKEEDVAAIRTYGYEALNDLFETKRSIEARLSMLSRLSYASEKQQAKLVELTQYLDRMTKLIDQVGGQRYCTTSRLFWHTDLDAALKEAEDSKKPVLSLRMLGKLTEEYSCANSRFFRTTLYSNENISKQLRESFVLHWQSVRPVPRITIDFGDGRKLERTITGNSAHYVLDPSSGQPLDCLPGLHGPGAFKEWLSRCSVVAKHYAALEPESGKKWLQKYHRGQSQMIGRRLQSEMAQVDPDFEKLLTANADNHFDAGQVAKRDPPAAPAAINAAQLAVSKSIVEIPILNLAFSADSMDLFEQEMNDGRWERLAALHAGVEKLDEASVGVIANENPTAAAAGELTVSKRKVEDPLVALIDSLQRSILLDTVRNEYLLHRRIHEWFGSDSMPKDVESLNKRVYAELFLTPDTDPWLGLKPKNVYSALENDGITMN